MNEENNVFVIICTKRDLTSDELVDEFRRAGSLKEEENEKS